MAAATAKYYFRFRICWCRCRHLEKWIWRHISAADVPIWTKFSSLMQNNMQITVKWSRSKPEVEFQHGKLLYFENGNGYISAANWDSTKFGLLIDFDILKAATSTNTKPEVVYSGSGRHLEKWIWRHISAVGAAIWTKFGSLMQNKMQITANWSRSKPEVVISQPPIEIISTKFGLRRPSEGSDIDRYETGSSIQPSRPPSWEMGMTSYFRSGCFDFEKKIGSLMQNNVHVSGKWSKSKVDFQYGGRLFFKNGSSCISAINWDMSTKFGLLIDFDLLKAAISTNAKPVIVLSVTAVDLSNGAILNDRLQEYANVRRWILQKRRKTGT